MPTRRFAAQLDLFGPQALTGRSLTLGQARRYCRNLARNHYENFSVASCLLPKHLRQPFCDVYAYCRWADDLADETSDARRSLELLDWWQEQLDDCYRGRAGHPVFVALAPTIEDFNIPRQPLADLLVAFRQDQRKRSYETFGELIDYCRNSANPVGRIVLCLGRCDSDENRPLSDAICTGLQLANFWQDVARDDDSGRTYIPRESRRQFGYDDDMLQHRRYNDAFRQLLAFEVKRAKSYLLAGWPLVDRVSPELRIDVDLFVRGGLAVLDAIRGIDYNVWSRRPTVGKLNKLMLLTAAWKKSRKQP